MRRRLVCRAALLAVFAASSVVAAPYYPLRVPLIPDPFAIDVQGKLEFLDVERVDGSSPYQNPQGKLRLHIAADLSSRFQVVTDLTGTAGGTPRNASGPGVYDLGHVLQDVSPSLEIGEAYFESRSQYVDLRAGLQKFAWGKLDALQPNDLLNPQKVYDPILEDENDRKNGIPAVAPTFYVPDPKTPYLPSEMRLTLVWAPIFVPYYFPDQDERWYPPLARVPAESQVMGFTVQNHSQFENGKLPGRTWKNGTWAARFSALWGGADFALYYFEGTDPAPSLDARADGLVRIDPLDPALLDIESDVHIFPAFHRVRAAGGDLAYKLFDATLRVEGAYVFDRAYPRSIRDIVAGEQIGDVDLVSLALLRQIRVPVTLGAVNVQRDGVEWGAGGDMFVGDTFVLLQVNQTALLRNSTDLLISDLETRFAMTLRRGFFGDRLTAELIGLYGMQGVYGIAHPRLTYAVTDYVDVRIGYVLIEGHTNSIIGQYRDNDEGYVRVRYRF